MTKLLLVDDHLIVRRGLSSLLNDEEDLTVVAEASTVADARKAAIEHQPDVAILDLRLADGDGIELASELQTLTPNLHIMVLSSYVLEKDVHRAFASGVLSYLPKDTHGDDLLSVVRKVARGERYLTPEVSLLLAKSTAHPALTERELEILKLIAKGQTNKEIATLLHLSENTVKNHVKSILAKLQANDRTHAVAIALERGWFQL
ncbi:MAG: response regulator transcription factor [Verrucomicrobiota bacterium]